MWIMIMMRPSLVWPIVIRVIYTRRQSGSRQYYQKHENKSNRYYAIHKTPPAGTEMLFEFN